MLIFFSLYRKTRKIIVLYNKFFFSIYSKPWAAQGNIRYSARYCKGKLMKKDIVKFRPCRFTEADRAVLDSYRPVVEALGAAFGPLCQIVLASLEEPRATVVALANGHISHRYVGEPVMPDGLEFLEKHAWLGSETPDEKPRCREIRSSDGRRLRNSNVGIFNGTKLIGYLGVNVDMDMPLADFVDTFRIKTDAEEEGIPRHFDGDSSRFLVKSLEKALEEENRGKKTNAKQRVKRVIARMEALGAFNVRGAVDFVAQRLEVSRNTVYLHLRTLREDKLCGGEEKTVSAGERQTRPGNSI